MEIIIDYPPIIDQIDAVFDCRNQNVIYAWGNVIYNPKQIFIPDFLISHEKVHGQRQGADVEGWWKKYMEDIEFRYSEELYSHAAEYKHRVQGVKDRNQRNRLLMQSAARLAAPLYGSMTSVNKAMQDIKKIYS